MSKNSSKKGSFRSSRQDTAELDKSWFSDLEPPKVYNQKSSKSTGKKRTTKSNTNLKRKPLNKGSEKRQINNLEPPQRVNRQQSDSYSNTQSRRNLDNLTQAEKRAKQNKNRKRKNKIRKILITILVIILLAAVSVVLSLTVFFPINEVSISGNSKYTSKEISAVCGIDVDENLFLTDTNKAITSLEKELPYIYSVKISRKLPGTIKIAVTETKPKYQIKADDGSYVLLDDNFKVLENGANKYSGATIIKKAEVKTSNTGETIAFKGDTTLKYLKTIKSAIDETKVENITTIASVSAANNYIVYDGRITIKFGDTDNMEYKIYQSLATIDKLQDDNPQVKGIINATGDKSIYFTEK